MKTRWIFKIGYNCFTVDQEDEAKVMEALTKLIKVKETYLIDRDVFIPDTTKMEISCVLVKADQIQT